MQRSVPQCSNSTNWPSACWIIDADPTKLLLNDNPDMPLSALITNEPIYAFNFSPKPGKPFALVRRKYAFRAAARTGRSRRLSFRVSNGTMRSLICSYSIG
jgi:hypothetical protein